MDVKHHVYLNSLSVDVKHRVYLNSLPAGVKHHVYLNSLPADVKHHVYLNSLPVGVEGSVGEALALVVPEEFAVAQTYVVNLVARATPVYPLPLLAGHLSFPAREHRQALGAVSFLTEREV